MSDEIPVPLWNTIRIVGSRFSASAEFDDLVSSVMREELGVDGPFEIDFTATFERRDPSLDDRGRFRRDLYAAEFVASRAEATEIYRVAEYPDGRWIQWQTHGLQLDDRSEPRLRGPAATFLLDITAPEGLFETCTVELLHRATEDGLMIEVYEARRLYEDDSSGMPETVHAPPPLDVSAGTHGAWEPRWPDRGRITFAVAGEFGVVTDLNVVHEGETLVRIRISSLEVEGVTRLTRPR